MKEPTRRQSPRLAATVDGYLDYAKRFRGLSDQTILAYRRDSTTFLDWAQAHGLPDDPVEISREQIQQYLNSLAGLSPATIRRAAYSLSGFFAHLQREGQIQTNPAAGVLLPKRRRKLPKVPTMEQAERLIAAACDDRDRAIINLLLMTGLRRSELLGLDCEAVSPDFSEVRIIGKGDAERLIPLPPDAQIALARHIEKESITGGPVFRNRADRRMGNTTLQRLWRRLLRRAGLEDEGLTVHSCRHGYATMLIRAGTDIRTVQELLGHADLSTTATYLHTDLRTKREAVANLPLGGGSEGGDAR